MYIGYNLLCKDLSVDFLPESVKFYTKIIQLYYNKVLYESKPPMAKIIAKLFHVSFICPNEFNDFLKALFNSDTKEYENTRRSMSICYRGLFLIMNINDVTLSPDCEDFERVRKVPQRKDQRRALNGAEVQALLKHDSFSRLDFVSPRKRILRGGVASAHFQDCVRFRILTEVEYISAKDEKENKKFSMNIDYLFLERPSLMFADLCPMVKEYIKCPEDGNFRIQSYCDSEYFSENWLIKDILAFINRCVETKLFEMGIQMIGKFWPLIEHRNNFSLISNTFKTLSLCYSEIAAIPPEVDRLFIIECKQM